MSQPGEPIFEEIVGGPLLQTLDSRLVSQGTGDHDHRYIQAPIGHQAQGSQRVELGHMVVKQDEVQLRVKLGNKVDLGLDPFAQWSEAGTAKLVEDQSSVVVTIFEQKNVERSRHRRLLLSNNDFVPKTHGEVSNRRARARLAESDQLAN